MNKGWKKFLILLAVFIAALLGFAKLMNREAKDLTTDMAEATLPVVYLQQDDSRINELHGYVKEMNAVSMRDTITPLEENGILPLQIDTFGAEIKGISFEVRSLDTQRLVQDTEVEDYTASKDSLQAQLQVQDLLEENQEYLLILNVETEDETCCYYTRIIREADTHIQECLEFVEQFHEITMDKDRQAELAAYMEPSAAGDNTTLQTVTINSSLAQACWADFEGTELTEPVASIKELNDAYHVILLEYIMSATGEDGESEYYNVEEYYRVRYGTEKIYLLSFERNVEEIFRSESNNIQADQIDLGIRSAEVDYKINETGNIICFEQQGELWSYNLDENELTEVFSFRSTEGMDVRENYNEHGIRIVRIAEGGSIDFVVYGYMNRGDHEGEVGISVCHYDCVTNTVEEQIFIPSDQSYQIMKEEIGKLMYISEGGMFYIVMGQQVHQVNLQTREDTIFIDNLENGVYQNSENGRYLSWVDSTESQQPETMHLTDLETAVTYDINAEDGQAIHPLGFIGTDCIYGIARKKDLTNGNLFVMRQVYIIDSSDSKHTVLKTYKADGSYVTGVTVSDGSIYLERVRKKDGVYVEISQDTIRNRDMQEQAAVYVSEKTTDIKQREVVFQLSEEISAATLKHLVPKQIIAEESTELKLQENQEKSSYYVYAKGKVLLAGDDVAAAIRSADENRGVVIGENQTYVWKRGKKQSQQALSIAGAAGDTSRERALAAMISMAGGTADVQELLEDGKTPLEVLQTGIPNRPVYNLTGCSLEQVLYFIGLGIPVYAQNDAGEAVLLNGYDDNYVWVYNTSTKQASSRLLTTASEMFADAGNIFYSIGES